jgi:hypothetical protein
LDQDGTHFLADRQQFWLTVKWKNTPSGRINTKCDSTSRIKN